MPHEDGENSAGGVGAIESVTLRAPIHKDDAIWKLEVMSRRGRLPGFRRTVGGFAVAAHGTPFDKTLNMKAQGGGDSVAFTPELLLDRKMPTITLVLFAATVWPGVMLTDSFLYGHFQFYMNWINDGLQTWWWYIPLTVISLVMAWFSAMKKSNISADASAHETMQKLAAEIDGTVEAASS